MRLKALIAASILSVFAMLAVAQQAPRYKVIDLGPNNNPFSQAEGVNNSGLITGVLTAEDGSQHAVIWYQGFLGDMSQLGFGGQNSVAGIANNSGSVLGITETSARDPNNENFCGFGTDRQCTSFIWRYGVAAALPTLGGPNSNFGWINSSGQAVGMAETNKRDTECPKGKAVNGTGPQVLDFEAVVWGPEPGQIRQLPPLLGDSVGMAFGINDAGQVVGISGRCANTILPGFTAGPHAVLWETDGSVHDLGNLGGTVNPSILAVGNGALAINNRGQVTGLSALPGDETFHPILWTKTRGLVDLGVLPGDLVGAGLGINNRGEIVGASISAPGPASGNPRAFLWRNGEMYDLNELVPENAALYMLSAFSINDSGEIAGFGVTDEGEIHAFLAFPSVFATVHQDAEPTIQRRARPVFLTDDARKQLMRRSRLLR